MKSRPNRERGDPCQGEGQEPLRRAPSDNYDEGQISGACGSEAFGWDQADFVYDSASFINRNSTAAAAFQEAVPEAESAASVSIDRERQILLLILLGQVCALHDPTPRAFTAHVLELFERGILDRQSILFLYKHGLVPYSSPPPKLLLPPPLSSTESEDDEGAEQLILTQRRQRSEEVSAIRNNLEQQELLRRARSRNPKANATAVERHSSNHNNNPFSFSAEHHPLSLSRFQREFENVRLISSGAFGTVYQATSKMDGRDYAIKRVEFAALGYAQDSMQQVIREVHCLAVCDHVNVVRYFTSWMEPSWMAGSSKAEEVGRESKHINQMRRLVTTDYNDIPNKSEDSVQSNLFKSTVSLFKQRHSRRHSWGQQDESSYLDDSSDWSVESSQDDSVLDFTAVSHGLSSNRRRRNKKDEAANFYRYHICLFIQMQLCTSVTLADWIQDRNCTNHSFATRLDMASRIFRQMCLGLAHVHHQGIIHRDLKPANVFVSHEADGLNFKIGDFGLSKLIQSTMNDSSRNCGGTRKKSRSPHGVSFEECDDGGNLCILQPSDGQVKDAAQRREPLTAGVGTASYASPEQVTSRSYENSADIFSLGLILLELLCCFSTEHERLKVFRECRQNRKLPHELIDESPTAVTVILDCTEHEPSKRPTARELSEIDLQKDSRIASPKVDEVQRLMEQLREKDTQIERQKQELAEKQRVIDSLRLEVERLKGGIPAAKFFSLKTPPSFRAENEFSPSVLASSSSSSSEDEL